ncbi:hypothetical protein V5O48_010744, partial [Marasmius crinis-equi]
MDLEDFEATSTKVFPRPPTNTRTSRQSSTIQEAFEFIEADWYRSANRHARWMDLIGDYGGKEFFAIEGDSLISIVLSDPQLAIGGDDPSFQILHAYFLLERLLKEYKSRDANFGVVFFQDNRHISIQTSGASFKDTSRALARKMLFNHLVKPGLDIDVHIFQNTDDPQWNVYRARRRPMFIMVNGGDNPSQDSGELVISKALISRGFLFRISSQGLSFALMNGAEYRDSSISTFVFESSVRVRTGRLPTSLNKAFLDARRRLDGALDTHTPLELECNEHTSLASLIRCGTDSSQPNSSASSPPPEFRFMFVLHCVLLHYIPVQSRARPLPPTTNPRLSTQAQTTLSSIFRSLTSSTGRPPDIDGHIFIDSIYFLVNESGSLASFPVQAVEEVTELWRQNGELPLDLARFAENYPNPDPQGLPSNPKRPHVSALLPFQNNIFDDALASVQVPQSEIDEPPNSIFGEKILVEDTQHWHNRKKSILPSYLGGETNQPTDEDRRRWMKREQRAQASLQQQAASLTGASGRMLHKVIIPSVGPKDTSRDSTRPSGNPRRDVAKVKTTGADKARAQIQQEKIKNLERDAGAWLEKKIHSLQALPPDERLSALADIKRSANSNATFPPVATQLRVYEITLRITQWEALLTPQKIRNERDRLIVSLLLILKEIKSLGATVSEDCAKFLDQLCHATGLDSCSEILVPSTDKTRPGLPFKVPKLFHKKDGAPYYPLMKIDAPVAEWQLEHFGDYMDRSMESAPDGRVSFEPDRWQRDILDAIDHHQSVLALAPTSAGKTFISFYAMEKVLRESDRGVVVYVAPTKALVNQIAAEVYGRFSKNYKGNETLLAVQTRDTRTGDIQRAQILVTVPEMFGILLLSPDLAKNWTSRIRRIILDEIHCIGQDEGGAIWEQIILMAPCPIVGLSATVGSPGKFNNWLKSVQESHNFKHTFVHHPHRYSHLRKFFYNPPDSKVAFSGLRNHRDTEGMTFVHPLSFLDDRSASMPADLALEARDCLSLSYALKVRGALPSKLEPHAFFAGVTGLIAQKDVLLYEERLKEVLAHISERDREQGTARFKEVLSLLEHPNLEQEKADRVMTKNAFKDNLLTLVCDLNNQGNLPGIFFSFDRSDCEIMAKSLTKALTSAEANWRATSREWKAKLSHIEKWREQEKLRQRQRQREAKQKKDTDAARESSSASWEASFDEADPLEEFSLAGRFPGTSQELKQLVYELKQWSKTPQWAIEALERGIAVHHAGMPKKYRTTVENLFRQGFIRVMISTGTLALGINAPAKTSVFCGDSPYLTALMYRQCAGRAGRRGFDLRGNVVFYGLPYSRVQRLVLSRLPDLGDSFPLTTTLILRFFNLLEGSQNSEFAVQCVQSILDLPRISHRSELGKDQVLHHVRFSIEYLRSSGLLSSKGQPTNLFGMASHLYYTEPSNFALVHLFESGIIHKICSGKRAESDLLLLFCHLFGRINVTSSTGRDVPQLRKEYPSLIILPKLPSYIGEHLQQHDSKILEIFSSYALSYAEARKEELSVDDSLPLSGAYSQ